jgi:hypothetical protein
VRAVDPHPALRARDWVAIILSGGFVVALNLVTAAVLWTAINNTNTLTGGLSENATQIITGAFGGILGVLGSYLGFRIGEQSARRQQEELAERTSTIEGEEDAG